MIRGATSSSVQQIGKILDFCKFVFRPVASPKVCRSCLTLLTSVASGQTNNAASSTYKLVRNFIGSAPIGVSSPAYVALFNILCKGSIASMNNISDRGSPCRKPRRCRIGVPGIPFSSIREVVHPHKIDRISRHLCPNPNFSSASRRYSHRTLSKALAVSSLRNNIGVLALWK